MMLNPELAFALSGDLIKLLGEIGRNEWEQ